MSPDFIAAAALAAASQDVSAAKCGFDFWAIAAAVEASGAAPYWPHTVGLNCNSQEWLRPSGEIVWVVLWGGEYLAIGIAEENQAERRP